MSICTREFGTRDRSLIWVEIGACRYSGNVLVFLIPCVIEGALLLYFLRGFRAPVSSNASAGGACALPAIAPRAVRRTAARSGHLVTELADG
jgi:hypothetical protein